MEENEKTGESEKSEEEEVEAEERQAVSKKFPSNKYELAIVAAQEARRLNEAWKGSEEPLSVRVTEKALDRVNKGEVNYTIPDNQGR